MKDINKETLTAGIGRVLTNDEFKPGALRWMGLLRKKPHQIEWLIDKGFATMETGERVWK